MDRDNVANTYAENPYCLDYCGDIQFRKVAIIAALDNTSVFGKCGSEIFPEYSSAGVIVASSLRRGRGLSVAANIIRPVVTRHTVVCCCHKLAIFLSDIRNVPNPEHTNCRVRTDWD